MKRFFKILFISLLVIFAALQLYPKPPKNDSGDGKNDIAQVQPVPPEVLAILKNSCYDCHSNQTSYPWYSRIQPVASWPGNHIDEGKRELNFSEFGSYSLRRQYHKLEEVGSEVEEDKMPLKSYTFIHRDARLSAAQKQALSGWVTKLREQYRATYPADSLERKKR